MYEILNSVIIPGDDDFMNFFVLAEKQERWEY